MKKYILFTVILAFLFALLFTFYSFKSKDELASTNQSNEITDVTDIPEETVEESLLTDTKPVRVIYIDGERFEITEDSEIPEELLLEASYEDESLDLQEFIPGLTYGQLRNRAYDTTNFKTLRFYDNENNEVGDMKMGVDAEDLIVFMRVMLPSLDLSSEEFQEEFDPIETHSAPTYNVWLTFNTIDGEENATLLLGSLWEIKEGEYEHLNLLAKDFTKYDLIEAVVTSDIGNVEGTQPNPENIVAKAIL